MENVQFDRKNASHSLAEVALVIAFQSPVSGERLEKLKSLPAAFKDRFPAASENKEVSLSVTDNQSSTVASFNGWTLEKKDFETDLIEWQLAVEKNRIVIKGFEYETWGPFKSEILFLFQKLSAELDLTGFPVKEIIVQFVDRFHWMVRPEEYRLEKFFNVESQFLPIAAKRGGPLWHVFQGWFEVSDGVQVIMNLNASTQTPAQRPHRTEILHSLRAVGSEQKEGFESADEALLDKVLEKAHIENKKTLKDLLSDEAVESIGL
ncbi:MAG: tRNA-dihydrouridine synthase A [Rhodopirellula sp.]|nr:tRNA-dihydrouridine synthase A [Rhodopirellula sp.]